MSSEIARLGSAFFLVRRPGADLRKPSAEVTSSEFHHGKNLRSPAGKPVSRSASRRLHGLPEKIRNSWRGLPRSLPSRNRFASFPAGAADHRPDHARARQPGCRFLTHYLHYRRNADAAKLDGVVHATATSPRLGSLRPHALVANNDAFAAPCNGTRLGSLHAGDGPTPCASISAARCCLSSEWRNRHRGLAGDARSRPGGKAGQLHSAAIGRRPASHWRR